MQMCQCGFVWNRVQIYIKHMTFHTVWGMTTDYYFSESHDIWFTLPAYECKMFEEINDKAIYFLMYQLFLYLFILFVVQIIDRHFI